MMLLQISDGSWPIRGFKFQFLLYPVIRIRKASLIIPIGTYKKSCSQRCSYKPLKRLGLVLPLEEFDVVDDQFYLTGQTNEDLSVALVEVADSINRVKEKTDAPAHLAKNNLSRKR